MRPRRVAAGRFGDGRRVRNNPAKCRRRSRSTPADATFSRRHLIAPVQQDGSPHALAGSKRRSPAKRQKKAAAETSTLVSAESIRKLFPAPRRPKGRPAQFSALSLRMLSKRILVAADAGSSVFGPLPRRRRRSLARHCDQTIYVRRV